MSKRRPETVIVKRRGSKWEAVGTLAIVAAMVAPACGAIETPAAVLIGAAGLLVFIVGRFL